MATQSISISTPRFNVARILLGLSMFFTGASGLVSEYVLGTVATYILGNSIEQMSIIIATMLLAMGIGGWLTRFISEKALADKFVLLESILALLVGFAPIAIYAAFGLLEHHFRLVLYFFVMTIGVLVGFEIPLVMRINKSFTKKLKVNISEVFGMDYIGAFVGAMVWVFFLLKTFPLTEISFLVAGSNFVVALVTFAYFFHRRLIHRPIALAGVTIITLSLLVVGWSYNRSWSMSLEQRLYDSPIVLAETTKYQRIVLTHYDRANDYRLFLNGNLQFSSVDEVRYHEQLVHPVLGIKKSHKRVLILGGGDGLALREVLKYPSVESVLLVDLDEGIVRISANNPILREINGDAFSDARVKVAKSEARTGLDRTVLQETPKSTEKNLDLERVASVKVMHVDADRFLSGIPELFWDVVIIDFPDPNSVELSKLYSKQFYMKLRRHMAPGSVMSIQSTSPYHAKESFLCIGRTLRAAGFNTVPYHDNVPSFGDWGWYIASSDYSASLLRHQMQSVEFGVETEYLTPKVLIGSMAFGKGDLESRYDAINTLMEPVLHKYYTDESWIVD